MIRTVAAVAALASALLLVGCAGIPESPAKTVSSTRVAPATAPLMAFAREAAVPTELSAFRALPQAAFALDTRLELIRRAEVALDLQCYLIADDETGRLILRELDAAAARGVRVRLLLDDLYARGLDELLLGFAAQPNVEVRLFNPFAYGRDSKVARLWQLATDFHRLNHRMHNKLFLADGAMAVAGGRNLANEYFFRNKNANFIDFDLLVAGALVPELGASFDTYWNSDQAYPLEAVATSPLSKLERHAAFRHRVAAETTPNPEPTPPADLYGDAPLGVQIDRRRPSLLIAPAGALADRPEKIIGAGAETVSERYYALLREAESEVILISPYFIPGKEGVERLRELRQRGIAVRVVTNSTSSSDEPLVNNGFAPYRLELLRMGVQLFEVESVRLKRDAQLRGLLGRSSGRLHAKLTLIDRKRVLAGSMNVDPRSSRTNTEIGIGVRSEELAHRLLTTYRLDAAEVVYEVRLKADGKSIEWVGRDGGDDAHEELLNHSPATNWLQRLRLFMLGLIVPEDLL